MLKFIKSHLDTIAGVEIFPLISFIIFFVFFLVLLVWVFRADKRYIMEAEQLPLDQDPLQTKS
jgi:cytochrome c oxidase cbb3-type subunit IV